MSTEQHPRWIDEMGHFTEAKPDIAKRMRKDIEATMLCKVDAGESLHFEWGPDDDPSSEQRLDYAVPQREDWRRRRGSPARPDIVGFGLPATCTSIDSLATHSQNCSGSWSETQLSKLYLNSSQIRDKDLADLQGRGAPLNRIIVEA